MNPADRHDLMLAYVVGCTDDDECGHIEAWLASGDVTAHAAYAEAIAVLHTLPLAIDPIEPPAALRARVLKRCNCPPILHSFRWPLYGMTALAACLAVALTLSMMRDSRDSARWKQVSQVMASRDVSFAKLNVTPVGASRPGAAQGAYGRMLYCPVTKIYEVNVFDLAPPPPGKVYQLWLITADKKPMPAGLLAMQNDGQGSVMIKMPQAGVVAAAAITDEPDGGSPAPTGKIHLSGQLTADAAN